MEQKERKQFIQRLIREDGNPKEEGYYFTQSEINDSGGLSYWDGKNYLVERDSIETHKDISAWLEGVELPQSSYMSDEQIIKRLNEYFGTENQETPSYKSSLYFMKEMRDKLHSKPSSIQMDEELEKLSFVDSVLTILEDYAHGEEGRKITESRRLLHEVISHFKLKEIYQKNKQ